MGKQLFSNNAASTLNGTLTQGGTTLILSPGTGDRFPAPAGGDFALVTLYEKDVSNNETRIEVVSVSARTADTLTIVRDVESMTGQTGGYAYPSVPGNTVYVELRWTAAGASNCLQKSANLSDLSSAATARTNLGLGDSATKNTGTATGTVAAGDHAHAGVYEPASANIQTHIASTSNPHGVSAAQVGLGNAENKNFATGTADATHAATSKTTPVDADELPLSDSAAAYVLKKFTWANLKTTLGSLFAPLASPSLTGTPTAPTAVANTNTTQIATTAHVYAERSNAATLTNKTISGGSISGIADLAVVDGGTGASDAATARSNLGAAAIGANTFTGAQALGNNPLSGIKTATFNGQGTQTGTTGALNIDWSTAQNFLQTEPTGAITYTFTAPPGPCHLQLLINSDGTSTAQVITWPATVKWIGAIWAGANNKAAVINFWYDGANYWAMGANQV